VTVSVAIPQAWAWTPATPTTYAVETALRSGPPQNNRPVQDAIETRFGMRSVAVVGTELQVQGAAVFLKGVNWHEETGASGRSMTTAEYDDELGHLVALGANLMRNCVYNRHPYAYEWADAHGVPVMDDTDNMWLNTAQERLQTESYGLSRALTSAMVWNQHNHPSVILWGLQNESEIDGDGAPVYRAWLTDMKDAVRELDLHERPVTWASSTSWDPAFDLADVIGFNEYFGYFYGKKEDLGPTLDAVHANHPDKPIAITENGTWSYLGHHGSADEAGTEEWQAANLQEHWDQVVARPYVAGYMFWVLKDYKQRLGYNQEYNGISTMGLLGWDSQTRRLAFDVFRDAVPPR
jgi:beta-glucuronidase